MKATVTRYLALIVLKIVTIGLSILIIRHFIKMLINYIKKQMGILSIVIKRIMKKLKLKCKFICKCFCNCKTGIDIKTIIKRGSFNDSQQEEEYIKNNEVIYTEL
jgi:hypothetical protein